MSQSPGRGDSSSMGVASALSRAGYMGLSVTVAAGAEGAGVAGAGAGAGT